MTQLTHPTHPRAHTHTRRAYMPRRTAGARLLIVVLVTTILAATATASLALLLARSAQHARPRLLFVVAPGPAQLRRLASAAAMPPRRVSTTAVAAAAKKKQQQQQQQQQPEEQEKPAASAATAAPKPAAATRRRKRTDAEEGAAKPAAPSTAAAATGKKKRGGTTTTAAAATAAAAVVPAGAGAAAAVLLHTLPPLCRALVVNRPSKTIKSPYLADIQLLDDDEETKKGKGNGKGAKGDPPLYLCHTPSLGCMGLIAAGSVVLVAESASATAKSTHILHHVEVSEAADGSTHLVGTHPQTANTLALALLTGGHLLPDVASVAREVTLAGSNSRFDFVATHADGSVTVVECKNVPIADYCDGTKKERAVIMAGPDAPADPYAKIALFPEGYRKKVADPVSPRALKHVQELQAIAEEGDPKKRACLLFITQRTDVARLRITSNDPTYRNAVKEAHGKGVMMRAVAVRWDGPQAFLFKDLEFDWED